MTQATAQQGVILSSLGVLSRGEKEKIRTGVLQLLGRESLQGVRVAIIPTAADILFFKRYALFEQQWWRDQGAEVQIARIKDQPDQARQILAWAEVLYVQSGNTYHLMYWLNQSHVREYLPELLTKLVYVGASAGSIVAGPNISTAILTIDYNLERQYRDINGLGIVPFMVWPHHSRLGQLWQLGRERLVPLAQQGRFASNVEPIRNGEILMYHNGQIQRR